METPVLKDLVLVGGGHSHAIVLRRWGRRPLPGVRVTLVSRDVLTPYSGMLPGLVSGHYDVDDVHIDTGPLCRFAGARRVDAEVTGIDLEARRVLCADRPALRFDVLSINVGAVPSADVPGAVEHAVPVKPIGRFHARWQELVQRVGQHPGPLAVGIVGGGAGGVELALAIETRLRRELAGSGRPAGELALHLFEAGDEILPAHPPAVRERMTRLLEQRGGQLHVGSPVTAVCAGGLVLADGRRVALDEIVWSTGAGPAPWLADSGLAVDGQGFVAVRDTLESTSHRGVFAAGDVAAVLAHPREKAGVFAVRQGPPLERNLKSALTGGPLERFRPQREYLSILGTGDGKAVASRGRWSASGEWVWRWKDRIDRRFVRRFRELPEREPALPEVAPGLARGEAAEHLARAAMRCAGCGAKVGHEVLERVLARIAPGRPDAHVVGLPSRDDAAALRVPDGHVLVQSVDFLRALVDDPFTFGRIAAVHALGDVYAMGARASSALAVATIPYAPETLVEDTLEQLLLGVVRVLDEAGATLVGGHTAEGAELGLGLTVNGLASEAALLRKSGLAPGDALLLTKPLGTGVLFAADRHARAKGRWITAAIDSMLVSQGSAAECLVSHGATAATDVTGFGLVGHLAEMTRASGVGARLMAHQVPLLDGALPLARSGVFSSLQPANLARARSVIDAARAARRVEAWPLLFDPQTAGGLLAGVPASRVAAARAELVRRGYGQTAIIGEVVPSRDDEASIEVVA